MNIDQNGINFIKSFEGLRLSAYQDAAGVWTIGYGSTRYKNGKPVQKGDTLASEAAAADLLEGTLQWRVDTVNRLVKVPLTQNQFNAVLDFEYNEGDGALAGSHLLVKLNQKDYTGAAAEFLKWDEATNPSTHQKEVLHDLYLRRVKEMDMFLNP